MLDYLKMPLKMDGWNTILPYWGPSLFSGAKLLVAGRVPENQQLDTLKNDGLLGKKCSTLRLEKMASFWVSYARFFF